jgi:hypothetical protein
MIWFDIIKVNAYYKMATKQEFTKKPEDGEWKESTEDGLGDPYTSRQEVFDLWSNWAGRQGFTLEGDLYVGRIIRYEEGIFENISAPSFMYQILEMDEEVKDITGYDLENIHNLHGPEATKRKIEGQGAVKPQDEDFTDENR